MVKDLGGGAEDDLRGSSGVKALCVEMIVGAGLANFLFSHVFARIGLFNLRRREYGPVERV